MKRWSSGDGPDELESVNVRPWRLPQQPEVLELGSKLELIYGIYGIYFARVLVQPGPNYGVSVTSKHSENTLEEIYVPLPLSHCFDSILRSFISLNLISSTGREVYFIFGRYVTVSSAVRFLYCMYLVIEQGIRRSRWKWAIQSRIFGWLTIRSGRFAMRIEIACCKKRSQLPYRAK